MRILGIGVDIIENKRVKEAIKNKSFINRVYSVREQRQSNLVKNKVAFFSKRFAAKESLAKSIGTGFRNNLNLKDIEISNDRNGKPFYLKSQKIDKIILNKFKVKKYNLFLSISDENDYSVAFTMLQTK